MALGSRAVVVEKRFQQAVQNRSLWPFGDCSRDSLDDVKGFIVRVHCVFRFSGGTLFFPVFLTLADRISL